MSGRGPGTGHRVPDIVVSRAMRFGARGAASAHFGVRHTLSLTAGPRSPVPGPQRPVPGSRFPVPEFHA